MADGSQQNRINRQCFMRIQFIVNWCRSLPLNGLCESTAFSIFLMNQNTVLILIVLILLVSAHAFLGIRINKNNIAPSLNYRPIVSVRPICRNQRDSIFNRTFPQWFPHGIFFLQGNRVVWDMVSVHIFHTIECPQFNLFNYLHSHRIAEWCFGCGVWLVQPLQRAFQAHLECGFFPTRWLYK